MTTQPLNRPVDVAPSITVAGKTIEHNTAKWSVATNRHPTTYGASWGWVEGASGNLCWSNEEGFDRKAAGEAVKLHNEWLEEQKPTLLKLIEATGRQRKAHKRFADAKAVSDKAQEELHTCDRDVARLSLQVANIGSAP